VKLSLKLATSCAGAPYPQRKIIPGESVRPSSTVSTAELQQRDTERVLLAVMPVLHLEPDPEQNGKGLTMPHPAVSWWIAIGPVEIFGLEGGEALRVEPGTVRAVRVLWPVPRDLPPNFGIFAGDRNLEPVSETRMRVYLGPDAPAELIPPPRSRQSRPHHLRLVS
jgi:hypothetical protein